MRSLVVCAFVLAACSERSSATVDLPRGHRDTAVLAAAPICAATDLVAAEARTWLTQGIDPIGGGGPFAYGSSAKAPILQTIATLADRGVTLAPQATSHRWEREGDGARLTLEGTLVGEPGYLATFEFATRDGTPTLVHLGILRGGTHFACRGGALVPDVP